MSPSINIEFELRCYLKCETVISSKYEYRSVESILNILFIVYCCYLYRIEPICRLYYCYPDVNSIIYDTYLFLFQLSSFNTNIPP